MNDYYFLVTETVRFEYYLLELKRDVMIFWRRNVFTKISESCQYNVRNFESKLKYNQKFSLNFSIIFIKILCKNYEIVNFCAVDFASNFSHLYTIPTTAYIICCRFTVSIIKLRNSWNLNKVVTTFLRSNFFPNDLFVYLREI